MRSLLEIGTQHRNPETEAAQNEPAADDEENERDDAGESQAVSLRQGPTQEGSCQHQGEGAEAEEEHVERSARGSARGARTR